MTTKKPKLTAHQGGKARPKTPKELSEALASNNLDGRTKAMKVIRDTKTALAQDRHAAARAVLIHQIAVNLAILRAIEDHALKNPEKIISKSGKLLPLLAGDMAKIQTSTRAALVELRRMEGAPHTPSPKGKSAADLILEIDRGDE